MEEEGRDGVVEGGQRENKLNRLASMRGRQSGPRHAAWRAEAGPGQSDSAAARIYSHGGGQASGKRDPWKEAAVLQLDPKQQNSLPTLRRCKPVACLCVVPSRRVEKRCPGFGLPDPDPESVPESEPEPKLEARGRPRQHSSSASITGELSRRGSARDDIARRRPTARPRNGKQAPDPTAARGSERPAPFCVHLRSGTRLLRGSRVSPSQASVEDGIFLPEPKSPSPDDMRTSLGSFLLSHGL